MDEPGVGEGRLSPPMPEICCHRCFKKQMWRKQTNCLHCGVRLNGWQVASQLATQPAPWNTRKPEFPPAA